MSFHLRVGTLLWTLLLPVVAFSGPGPNRSADGNGEADALAAVLLAAVEPAVAPNVLKGHGWRIDGAPQITIKPYPKASCGYWGFFMSIDNFEARGSQSWKDCTSQAAKKCSGKYAGTARWTKLPDFLAVGAKLKFDASVSTLESNICGHRSIDSGLIVRGPGGLYMDVVERISPKQSRTITMPGGKPNQQIRFEVIAKTANLSGKAIYTYRYE